MNTLVAAYDARAAAELATVPEQIDLVNELGITDVRMMREQVGNTRTARWVGLGLLLACVVVIMLINSQSFSRILLAAGTALMLAAVAYLLVVAGASSVAKRSLDEQYRARVELPEASPAHKLGYSVGVQVMDDSTGHSTPIVVAAGFVGLLCVAGGMASRRSTRRS